VGAKAGAGGTIECPGCGFGLGASGRAEVVCPFCGTRVTGLPDRQAAPPAPGVPAKPTPQPAPPPPPPRPRVTRGRTSDQIFARESPEPAPTPPPPVADDDEDDGGSPYRVDGEGGPTVPCPGCNTLIPEGAKLCVHCGLDLTTGQKTARTFEPIHRSWEWGWPHARRLAVFTGLQAVNTVAVVTGILAGSSIPVYLVLGLVFAALQAFLLGTYDRIELTRTARGGVRLSRTWRFCFLKRAPRKVTWRGCESVAAGKEYRVGDLSATGAFDSPVDVPDDASTEERLVALTGRQPR